MDSGARVQDLFSATGNFVNLKLNVSGFKNPLTPTAVHDKLSIRLQLIMKGEKIGIYVIGY